MRESVASEKSRISCMHACKHPHTHCICERRRTRACVDAWRAKSAHARINGLAKAGEYVHASRPPALQPAKCVPHS
eukprot:gene25123-biopygen1427